MAYALRIGLRYLRSKKKRSVSVITLVAIGGVALGVGALLAVLSITSGFQREFRDKVLGVNAHVLVLKYGVQFDEYRKVIAQTERSPKVKGAAPFVVHEMMLAKGDRLSGVLVKGIDPVASLKVLDLPKQLRQGSLRALRLPGAQPPVRPSDDAAMPPIEPNEPSGTSTVPSAKQQPMSKRQPGSHVPSPAQAEAALQGTNVQLPDDAAEAAMLAANRSLDTSDAAQPLPGVAVGSALASQLGLRLGDRVKVVSPLTGLDLSAWSSAAHTPRSADFRVIAIFQAGFQEYDSRLVYMDLYEAQRFFEHGDAVTGVEVRLADHQQAAAFARRLEEQLGGSPFHTLDWSELNHNLFEALAMQKAMLSLVIATIIFVAAFNVIATLIMIVLEKKREVAILKAIGAKSRTILGIFMTQGLVIGVLGTLLGLALGGAICAYLVRFRFPLDPKVYLIDHLPIQISGQEFLLTAGIAMLICGLSTWIPSGWAARLPPAEGVRY